MTGPAFIKAPSRTSRSGSMEGGKLLQAKNAVKHGISLLREGDRFNVLSFATDSTPVRPGMVPVTPSNRSARSCTNEVLPTPMGPSMAM